ncbi:hypothetical protein FAVG1_11635 [Fusarium avenaceum]|nr:hypothetical protein FAVG1_11635 [Fusarium avenaceum]
MSSNPVATITNNLDCDVDIYDVFNPNTIADPGTRHFPEGANHSPCQPAAGDGTGNIEALNNNYYQQFPVAVMGTSLF